MSEAAPDVSSLRSALAGEVVTREDHGWEAARRAWILTADQRPPLVVFAESAADVAATVRFAAAFAPDTAARLAAVTRAHDPDGLFVANHVD